MTNSNSSVNPEELTEEQIKAREKLMRLAKEQGVKPMTLEKLRAMGDLWPEDENIDDFLNALREWRTEKSERDLF